ncbi:MAG TPA: hypothetical protein VM597_21845 [Gemmataceae bacterium]|nr:hypothetical protein [Gemmataceae bacterium]
MPAITPDDLNPLLDQFDGPGRVLSCYADGTGADGFTPQWSGPLATAAAEVCREFEGDAPARDAFERDLAAVRRELTEPTGPATRWRAVFSAADRGFFRVIPIDVPVRPSLVYDRSPYLVPLLAAALGRREYLAVHTDSHRARLYAATPGAVRPVADLEADVPSKQHSAGERWGLGQATIARHRDEAVHHYLKALVHRIEAAWADRPFAGLLLFGPRPMLEQVRKALPTRLRVRVERETPAAWTDEPAELTASIRAATLEALAGDEARELEGLWPRLTTGRGVAAGPAAVLDALQGGRLQPAGHGYLALGPDPGEAVGRCTRCHALAADAPRTCPRCQAPCRVGNLWEEAMLMAFRHGIAVHSVDAPGRLAPYGGIVAALADAGPAAARARAPVTAGV